MPACEIPAFMTDIFISHIHEDAIVANAVRRFLRRKLLRSKPKIFVSSSRLKLGDEWLKEVRRALKAARVVIAIFSPESVKRPWVNFESGGAWFSDGKVLIPLCIGGLNPAKLPKPYSNIQGASLEDEDTPISLYEAVVGIIEPGLLRLKFTNSDEEVQRLVSAPARWRVARRAAKTLRRWERKYKRQ